MMSRGGGGEGARHGTSHGILVGGGGMGYASAVRGQAATVCV